MANASAMANPMLLAEPVTTAAGHLERFVEPDVTTKLAAMLPLTGGSAAAPPWATARPADPNGRG